jgi:aldose 1-epimerase
MNICKEPYGKTRDGRDVAQITIANDQGMTVTCITYGGIITSVRVPDKNGSISEVSPGFDSIHRYEQEASTYFGALLGRFANRIKNGAFRLDGKEYKLEENWINTHHMHGGFKGFDKVIWKAKEIKDENKVGVKLLYRSVDGDEGYPGNVEIEVSYILNNQNELVMEFFAQTDQATPMNISSHVFWNLAGSGTIKEHDLELNSDFYLPVDPTLLVTGEVRKVQNTPMDFKKPKRIGQDLDRVEGGGYDHCFCLNRYSDDLEFMARLYEPASGRVMEVYTTMPGFHFYSGFFLNNLQGRKGEVYPQYGALALETEYFPDCVNHSHFPSCILKPGQKYQHKTVYKFLIK